MATTNGVLSLAVPSNTVTATTTATSPGADLKRKREDDETLERTAMSRNNQIQRDMLDILQA